MTEILSETPQDPSESWEEKRVRVKQERERIKLLRMQERLGVRAIVERTSLGRGKVGKALDELLEENGEARLRKRRRNDGEVYAYDRLVEDAHQLGIRSSAIADMTGRTVFDIQNANARILTRRRAIVAIWYPEENKTPAPEEEFGDADFPHALKIVRISSGLKRTDVAGASTFTTGTIERAEQGRRPLGILTKVRIAQGLGRILPHDPRIELLIQKAVEIKKAPEEI